MVEALKDSPIGRTVPIHGHDSRYNEFYEVLAYVPHPLPQEISFTSATLVRMSEADRALGALNAHMKSLPKPELLVQPAIASEAKATSAIEGTYATLDDIFQADYIDKPRSHEMREVRNYISAALLAIERIQTLPISKRLLEELHQMLIRGTRGDGYDAGRIRQKQVFVGDEDARVSEAKFIPCPFGAVLEEGFSDWEKWVNSRPPIPLLARVALAHYQFETLHPFSDGNGRLGRLLTTLQLMAEGELEYPVLNLSAWFEPRKDNYKRLLFETSVTGDFDPLIRMFADAVVTRAADATNAIDAVISYRDSIVERAKLTGVRIINEAEANFVLGHPSFTIAEMRDALGMANNSAASRVRALEDLGVVVEITGGSYRRFYYARQLVRLFEH